LIRPSRRRRIKPAFVVLAAVLTGVQPALGKAAANQWVFGTEFDLIPFLNDGYYLSAVGGKGKLRPDFEGWWLDERRSYRTGILTLGGGYTWRFSGTST